MSDWFGNPPDDVLDAMIDAQDPETCEYVGHEWADAGGGLLICMVCQAEKWGDPRD